ncbi:MAG: hypothetical protein NVS1B10_06310 [Candidatus Saccharimonadales bacterium]
MKCKTCNELVETGAGFCGNCGQPLKTSSKKSASAQFEAALLGDTTYLDEIGYQPRLASTPQYAVANPGSQVGEIKALLSVLFGCIGLVVALFMAIIGLLFGIIGIVLGTLSRQSPKKQVSTVGMVLSSIAIVFSLGIWTFAIQRTHQQTQKVHSRIIANQLPAFPSSDLSTPCYSVGFVDKLNISNLKASCDMNAFNGQTIDTSSDAFKVYANQTQLSDISEFSKIAKTAVDKDVTKSLPGFSIVSQKIGSFAGSPTYQVIAYDANHNISVLEAAVYHKVNNGFNTFILVHAINSRQVDLSRLEAQWQWK